MAFCGRKLRFVRRQKDLWEEGGNGVGLQWEKRGSNMYIFAVVKASVKQVYKQALSKRKSNKTK